MNEHLENIIYSINHAVAKAAIHRSNGLKPEDTTYHRGVDIAYDLHSICEIINKDAGEDFVGVEATKVYEVTFFDMHDDSFGNTIQGNKSTICIGMLPLIRYENDGIRGAWYIYRD